MEQFVGTKPVAEKQRFDVARLEALPARACGRVFRPARRRAVQGRAVESRPTSCSRRRPALRDARQARAGGQAAAVGARGRARVPRDDARCTAPTCRCRACYCLCEDEAVIGRAFYVMDFVEGRVLWDQSLPGHDARASAARSTTR